MNGFLFDTHYWVRLQGSEGGSIKPAKAALVERWQKERIGFVSSASVWEIALLVSLNRLQLPLSIEGWIDAGTQRSGWRLIELSPEILIESTRLPGDLHRDPADRMLIATARIHGLTLITDDKLILKYASKYRALEARSL